MADKDVAVKDYIAGMSYKDIADKYNISESAVKSWASRYWNKDNKIKAERKKAKYRNRNEKKVATEKENKKVAKSRKKKKKGAPKGNINALGSGAPKGNHNALKHGGYSSIYWDTLDETEKAMLEEQAEDDEETQLKNQIALYTVRERRLLQAIRNMKERASASDDVEVYSSVSLSKENNKLTPTMASKNYEKIEIAVLRLERELSSVQRNKTGAINALINLRTISGENKDELLDDFLTAVIGDDEEE